jgi:hypothetical protein
MSDVPDSPTGGPIVPRPPQPPTGGPMQPFDMDGPDPAFWTNLRMDVPAERKLLMKCAADGDVPAPERINTVFPVKWLYLAPVESHDPKTAEVRQWIRTVLLEPDGRTTSFGSVGILRCLKMLVFAYGRGPWEPSLSVRLVQKELNGGRRLYLLEDATDEQPPPDRGTKRGK